MIAFLTSPAREEKDLVNEVKAIKDELEDIPMRQEYTTYVKTERKLLAAQTKLNSLRTERQTKSLLVQYGITYGSQFIITLALVIISIMYRYTPVIVFDRYQYDFVPFGGLIKFPTGIDGSVSVPFWIFVNSFVSKHAASYL